MTLDHMGNLSLTDPEAYSGEVRLGAAWDRGGIYASNGLSLSTGGSSFIDFVFGNSVPTSMNNSGAITFNNYNTGGIRVVSSGTSSSGASAPNAVSVFLTACSANGFPMPRATKA